MADHTDIVVAALYKFAPLADFAAMQAPLLTLCRGNAVYGTLLLAPEGINGTIAGPREGIDAVLERLRSDPRLSDLEHKESRTHEQPFYRMKVRLKKEIVTMGLPEVDPGECVGTYVEPEEWDKLIRDPDVLLIDTRNDYEVEIGTFQGAIDPSITHFREFPDYVRRNFDPAKHKKVAMFCTGGIRCEKASSFMLSEGFEEVYHLKGGILKYLERIPESESQWDGECFVFDERVSVDHTLARGQYDLCRGCRRPVSDTDKTSLHFEEGVCCHRCYETVVDFKRARRHERARQVALAELRGEKHVGREDAGTSRQ
jgi:UPF0176 protein